MKLKEIEDPGSDVQLKLYGLFKQSTIGKNRTKKPQAFEMVRRAKWEAWTAVGEISQVFHPHFPCALFSVDKNRVISYAGRSKEALCRTG